MSILVDNYSESNQDANYNLFDGNYYEYLSQCFEASISGKLSTCKFYVSRFGAATGNVYARLRSMTGTFGSSGRPTGSVLATSDAVDISGISESLELVTFTFSGEQYDLVDGNRYCITIEFTGGSTWYRLLVGIDESSPTHSGNLAYTDDGINWYAVSTEDVCFYVYSDDVILNISDTLDITESNEKSVGTIILDSFTIADVPSSKPGIILGDSITMSDSLAIVSGGVLALSDTIGIADTYSDISTFNRSLSDTFTIPSDSVATVFGAVVSISDTFTIPTESISLVFPPTIKMVGTTEKTIMGGSINTLSKQGKITGQNK